MDVSKENTPYSLIVSNLQVAKYPTFIIFYLLTYPSDIILVYFKIKSGDFLTIFRKSLVMLNYVQFSIRAMAKY